MKFHAMLAILSTALLTYPAVAVVEPSDLDASDGAAHISELRDFYQLAYLGDDLEDKFHDNLAFVKFTIEDARGSPRVYFMQTRNHPDHSDFARHIGLAPLAAAADRVDGAISYRPGLRAGDGSQGMFTVEFDVYTMGPRQEAYRHIERILELLVDHAPIFEGRIGFHPRQPQVAKFLSIMATVRKMKVPVYRTQDLVETLTFRALNQQQGTGMLRELSPGTLPRQTDIVLVTDVPDDLPQVAGIISSKPQRPLSHISLRARQTGVPNAYLAGADTNDDIISHLGKWVTLTVTAHGLTVRPAPIPPTPVEASIITLPSDDLTPGVIKPLEQVEFADANRFGTKAANLATLLKLLPKGAVPTGFALPFNFHVAFLAANNFNETIAGFDKDSPSSTALKDFRQRIQAGRFPAELHRSLSDVQVSFADRPIRCRSSANAEDLPNFSGAGIYDSVTHRAREGHLTKSIKEVYASLWTERAARARERAGIPHSHAQMGVLLHPNFEAEKADGIVVSHDVIAGYSEASFVTLTGGKSRVTQAAESGSLEYVLGWEAGSRLLNGEAGGYLDALAKSHEETLRNYLEKIYFGFVPYYDSNELIMEIEFKINAEDQLVVKQARPW